jgi:hypothetical protein
MNICGEFIKLARSSDGASLFTLPPVKFGVLFTRFIFLGIIVNKNLLL